MPGYDREEVSPGVIKRVVEAAFVKCLAGPEAMLDPEMSNMTSTVRRLYEVHARAGACPRRDPRTMTNGTTARCAPTLHDQP